MAEQTLRPYEPTWRDRLGAYLYDQTSRSPEARNFVGGLVGSTGLGTQGMSVADATPLGMGLQFQESAQHGDAKGMAMAALPMPAKAGAGMVKRAAEEVAGGMAHEAPHVIAYHGSPHNFDKFDMSKIGTGEGAQAYGHGLYFADSEGVARSYRDMLAGKGQNIEWNGKPVPSGADFFGLVDSLSNDDWRLAKIVETAGQHSPSHALATYEPHTRNASDGAAWKAALDKFKEGAGPSATGSMYQVRINADPEHFLDWDKPLSEQSPVVQERLLQTGWSPEHMKSRVLDGGYVAPTTPFGSQKYAEAGIPGIKYLDQGSRAAGDGSRNYVVFDDKLVEILKKYGLAGLLAGGGGMGMMQPKDAQASEPLRALPQEQPRNAVDHPPYDDKVQASARDANAYGMAVKDPYGYDDLAITLGRLTPGGRLMDAFGAYPTSAKGPLGPSVMQNINNDNYNALAKQVLGLWTVPAGGFSGIPYPENLIRVWMSKPLKRAP